jgi:hypothetical protein
VTVIGNDLRQRRHVLFTMLTACAWRDSPPVPPPVVAGLRTFLGGWLGIGRIVVGMARQSYDLQLTRHGEHALPGGPGALRHVGGRVGLGARAVDGCAASDVGESAEPGGGGDVMDLAGKYLVAWLSPEAVETFLGVLEPSEEHALTAWTIAGQVVGEAGPGLWVRVNLGAQGRGAR